MGEELAKKEDEYGIGGANAVGKAAVSRELVVVAESTGRFLRMRGYGSGRKLCLRRTD